MFLRYIISLFLLTNLLLAREIKHRFVASDESGQQLLMVDEIFSARNWKVKIATRDLQLIGDNRLLASTNKGYVEIDLNTGAQLKKYNSQLFQRVMTCRREKDGTTWIGGLRRNGVRIVKLDDMDFPKKTIDCPPQVKTLRLMRRTTKGTFLLGSGDHLFEMNENGKILWKLTPPEGKHIYKGIRLPNGNTLVSCGYGSYLAEFSPDGEIVREVGRTDGQKVKHPHFFADFQVLENGNWVVTNWMGHKREDSQKGEQLAEYDPEGKLVWTWHDDKLAGCLHAVIILDDLDTDKLHLDWEGPQRPVRQAR